MATIEDYTEKSIVVRGDTKPFAPLLKQLGGKWNTNLIGGPGWIFSKQRENDVRNILYPASPTPNINKTIPMAPTKPSRTSARETHFNLIMEMVQDNNHLFTPAQRLQLINFVSQTNIPLQPCFDNCEEEEEKQQ